MFKKSRLQTYKSLFHSHKLLECVTHVHNDSTCAKARTFPVTSWECCVCVSGCVCVCFQSGAKAFSWRCGRALICQSMGEALSTPIRGPCSTNGWLSLGTNCSAKMTCSFHDHRIEVLINFDLLDLKMYRACFPSAILTAVSRIVCFLLLFYLMNGKPIIIIIIIKICSAHISTLLGAQGAETK